MTDSDIQTLIDLGRGACRDGATRETNMVKTMEEAGEVARHVFRGTSDIEEVADLMLCVLAEASMIGATGSELRIALVKKARKGRAKKYDKRVDYA